MGNSGTISFKWCQSEKYELLTVPKLNLLSISVLVIVRNNAMQNNIFAAARFGLDTDIQRLVRGGAAINNLDREGWAAIHHAARYSRISTLRLLVEELETNVNAINLFKGQTAVHIVASNNNAGGGARPAIALLAELGADVNMKDSSGKTPLDVAIGIGNHDATAALLDVGAVRGVSGGVLSVPTAPAVPAAVPADIKARWLRSFMIALNTRRPFSLKSFIIRIVKNTPDPSSPHQTLGVRDPYNLSLDSYKDDMTMGMFFRYGPRTVVSISYLEGSNEPRVAALQASAPICAGQGRVIYSKYVNTKSKYLVHENSIDLTDERELCHDLSSDMEKNWGCFKRTSPGDYFIVKSLIPLRILRVQNGTDCTELPAVRRFLWAAESIDNPFVKKDYPNLMSIERLFPSRVEDVGTFRGTTRGIEFEQEHLFVGHVTVHQGENEPCFPNWYIHPAPSTGDWRMYFMFFYTIKFNNGVFSISRMSSCFHPPNPDTVHEIVFPVGIAERGPYEFVVSYGESDNDCRIASYTKDEISVLLAPVDSWNENNYVFHPNYATSLRNSVLRRSSHRDRSLWSTILSENGMGLIATSPSTEIFFNPAITNAGDGKFVTAWRKFNGDLSRPKDVNWQGSNEVAMEVCSLEIKDGKLVYSTENTPIEFQVGTTVAGGEDPRLIFENDCPLLLVNDLTSNGLRRMYIHNLKTDDSSLTVHPFCHNMSTSDDDEKNWGPFYHEGDLHFVYSVTPLVIGKPNNYRCPNSNSQAIQCEPISNEPTPENLTQILSDNGMVMRGGTPGIKLDNTEEYLFVGHSVQKRPTEGCFPGYIVQRFLESSSEHTHGQDVEDYNQQYMAFFYTLKEIEGGFKLHRISCCSHFPGGRQSFAKIHFPGGLAKVDLGGIFEDAFIVSVGVQDTHGVFCALNRTFLEYVLRPVEDWNTKNYIVDVNYFQNVSNLNPILRDFRRII